ncbi:hypothetical protein GCM10025789_13560 [Tessaracoccus lubricantis]|uniref:Chromate transporter n=1 Tax=Tessaracoccus lubricantis TaxID=545543 RepID=A0ABP9FA39_9ACTN
MGELLGQRWRPALPQLDALQLVLVTLAVIGVWSLWRRNDPPMPASKQPARPARAAWSSAAVFTALVAAILIGAVLLGGAEFLGLIGLSTVTSFGGGEAYVGVADGFFVASGIVPAAEFYGQAVPVANALPGPILVKIASAVGYSYGLQSGGPQVGLAFAVAAFVLSVAACCAVAMLLMGGYGRISNSALVRRLGAYVLPVICGLLITTCLSMVRANMDIAERAELPDAAVGWATVLGAFGLWWLQRRLRLHDVVVLLIAGGASLAALAVAAG